MPHDEGRTFKHAGWCPHSAAQAWPADCPEGAVELSAAWPLRRFKLPHKKQLLGLPAGQCLKVKAATFGKAGIEQAFNPVSIETPGEVVFLVKVRHSALPHPLLPQGPHRRSTPDDATQKGRTCQQRITLANTCA